ncbi:MAG: LamG domain-containing protein [Polyangiaceae bacterium]|nr:LamG domain-containing protein [Polyangiaceae bacterium]
MARRLGMLVVVTAAALASCFYDDKTLATGGTAAITGSGTTSTGAGGAPPCSAGATYEACVLASEPALYFRFDDPIGQACDSMDSSRCLVTHSENTGTEALDQGLVAGTSGGQEGSSRKLAGFYGYTNDDGDAISDAVAFIGHDSPWTLELWYERPAQRNGWLVWLHGASGGPTDAPKLQTYPNGAQAGDFSIAYHSDEGAPNWGIEHDFPAEQILHIVIRFDGTELDLHENGVRFEGHEGNDNTGVYVTPALFALAGYAYADDCDASGCWRFTGSIDEAAIYPRAITDDEIQAHYLRGSGQAP